MTSGAEQTWFTLGDCSRMADDEIYISSSDSTSCISHIQHMIVFTKAFLHKKTSKISISFMAWLWNYIHTKLWNIVTHPWASYQIRNIAGCACAGNAGNVFPRRRFQRKPLVSDPGMHHGTCVTHVPWCMSGSLACSERGKRSRHSRRMRTRNFAYLARGPYHNINSGSFKTSVITCHNYLTTSSRNHVCRHCTCSR